MDPEHQGCLWPEQGCSQGGWERESQHGREEGASQEGNNRGTWRSWGTRKGPADTTQGPATGGALRGLARFGAPDPPPELPPKNTKLDVLRAGQP